jgi:hypothetical protein
MYGFHTHPTQETQEMTTLHPDLRDFIASLMEIEQLLAEDGMQFWQAKIYKIRRIAENSDGACVPLFLRLYGGMGSFNDIVLRGPASRNDAFDKERRRAYKLARNLR